MFIRLIAAWPARNYPSRNRSLALLIATLLWLPAGCGQTSEAQRFDLSAADAYAAAEFKDDAPANAAVNAGDFPMAFVDGDGNPIDLSNYRGKNKVVLVVLRGLPQSPGGVFCPSCLAQSRSLMANRDEFVRRRTEVLVVFPGPADRVGEFFRRARSQVPGEPDRAFRILLDEDCSACDRLGIRDDLAKPSTYILDTRGNVVYAHVGETSTDRPSVKAILNQLDRAE